MPGSMLPGYAQRVARTILAGSLTGSVAVAPIAPPNRGLQVADVALTSGSADTSLGGGTALVMGPSGYPMPPPRYGDTADALYLQPHGFTGTPQVLFTPEGFYPTTGVKSLTADASVAQGAEILTRSIHDRIGDGGVTAENPVVVFGYSQSSALSSQTMTQLADQGVAPDLVRFVLVGDTAAPNGGLLTRFDEPVGSDPSIPSLGITFGNPTPDLYPADVYTLEYDGFADFPQYPLNLLADLNAMVGLVLEHFTYLGRTPEEIANAIPLETTADDDLTHYFVIPQDHLPLLDLVRFIPFIGNPLADLLEPDMKVLVNLGYGSIDHGWSDGPANVETPFGLFPPDLDWNDVGKALLEGIPQGIHAAVQDLFDPRNYDVFATIVDNPVTAPLLRSAYAIGVLDEDPSSFLDSPNADTLTELLNGFDLSASTGPPGDGDLLSGVNDLTATLSNAYAQLLPMADVATTLAFTLPAYNADLFWEHLSTDGLFEALLYPVAADTALIPFAIGLGLSGLSGGGLF